jgi:DNA helicase-2/ATP-dependent DNA helicase PcrA
MSNSSLEKVCKCLDESKSFLVEAGAGSGKTWTLIEGLRHLLKTKETQLNNKNQQIVCITYTNVAKDEIHERINHHEKVFVSTIHEFLWSVIKNYQIELKQVILDAGDFGKELTKEHVEAAFSAQSIDYSQYGKNLLEGRITHDDVIRYSCDIFSKHKKIAEIVSEKFPVIFVDEYQDTEERVVKLLLDNLLNVCAGKIVIGFFGDSMQKIYNQGVGVIEDARLEKITKNENYRCSKSVIGLLNLIRPNLQQIPSGNNLDGEIVFINCNNKQNDSSNFAKTISFLREKRNWSTGAENFKVLMLTHKVIATQLEYVDLLNVFSSRSSFGREQLYAKEDRFADLFFNKIEKICGAYEMKDYATFIELIGSEKCSLKKHSDKENIKKLMDGLMSARKNKTIGEVVKYIFEKEIFQKPKNIFDFEEKYLVDSEDETIKKNKKFYEDLMKLSYQQVVKLGTFIEEETPFSTKHGVKGAEYENVLVVIDDTSWNQYSFSSVFSRTTTKTQYARSLNLFYVCCSRAKDKLAVISLSSVDASGLANISTWFGADNVFTVESL